MEATIVYWGYIGIMVIIVEATIMSFGLLMRNVNHQGIPMSSDSTQYVSYNDNLSALEQPRHLSHA